MNQSINHDPEFNLMRETQGDWSVCVWLEMLAWADRTEGILPGTQEQISRVLAPLVHQKYIKSGLKKVQILLRFMSDLGWIDVKSTQIQIVKYAKYHTYRDNKKRSLMSPPNLTKPNQDISIVPSTLAASPSHEAQSSANGNGVERLQKLASKEKAKIDPLAVEWPTDMERVGATLAFLDADPVFFDPVYWQSLNAWTEATGLPVFPLDEFKAYLANQRSKSPGMKGKHRDLKAGFRNWLAIAIRMKERDRAREEQRQQNAAQFKFYRP